MADPIGALRVDLSANAAQFEKDMGRARRAVRNSTSRMGRNLSGFRASVDSAANSLRLMRNAVIGLAVGVAIRDVVRLADTMTLLESRLRLVTDSAGELERVKQALFEISQETRTAFESTATLYQRVARGRKELGKSTDEILQFTKTVQQLTVASGASSQEATNAVIQLSQGLASGQVRGEELRSVMEQLPAVALAAARGMNMTLGEFREASLNGEVSARQFFEAIVSGAEEAERDFNKLERTVGQAATQLQNQFMKVVDSSNQGSGATKELVGAIDELRESIASPEFTQGLTGIARGLGFLARNFDVVTGAIAAVFENLRTLTAGIAAFISYRAAIVFGGVATAVFRFATAVRGAALATTFLNAAMRANPIGLFATVVAGGVAALIGFSDAKAHATREAERHTAALETETGSIDGQTLALKQAQKAVLEQAAALSDARAEALRKIQADDLQLDIGQSIEIGGVTITGLEVARFEDLTAAIKEEEAAAESARARVVTLNSEIKALAENNANAGGRTSETAKKIKELAEGLQFEIDQLGRNESQQKLYNLAKKAGVEVNDEFRASIMPLIEQLSFEERMHKAVADAAEAEQKAKEELAKRGEQITKELRTEQEIYNDTVAELNDLHNAGELSAENYSRGLVEARKALDDASEATKRNDELARDLGLTFTSAFEDAVVAGGKLSDVLRGLEQDLIRLAMRQFVTKPLLGAVESALPSLLGGLGGGTLQATTGDLRNMGSFAAGGMHTGGFRIVGERGKELEATGPARYFSAGRTEDLLRGDGGPDGAPVEVNVYAPPGSNVETRESAGPGGRTIDVIIDETNARLIGTPGSRTGRALRQNFAGMQPQLKGRG